MAVWSWQSRFSGFLDVPGVCCAVVVFCHALFTVYHRLMPFSPSYRSRSVGEEQPRAESCRVSLVCSVFVESLEEKRLFSSPAWEREVPCILFPPLTRVSQARFVRVLCVFVLIQQYVNYPTLTTTAQTFGQRHFFYCSMNSQT